MKKYLLIEVSLIILLSVAGFLLINMPLSYSCLIQKQIDNFNKEENISPIAIKDIDNYTIILYETATEMANCGITSDQFGRISMGKGTGRNNSNTVPVSISGGKIYRKGAGSAEFVTVIFNDKNILEHASTVTILFDKGIEIIEQVNGHKGLIIPINQDNSALIQSDKDDSKDFSNVIVFGKNGKELFNLNTFQRNESLQSETVPQLESKETQQNETEPSKTGGLQNQSDLVPTDEANAIGQFWSMTDIPPHG